ncbi:cell wall metabolism sensor histidine kinase WalK [Fibrobacter sp. UWEL]|uniref:sensor histidine kinase n=1 Tax=Fibrobacter sp. UWEL TaxID=1896209 RepID=UPI0009105622|nr:HAMP domain-containing sensor histidine kinase [Fibrobacter sp. UWEL]SHK97267.1 His Kinase A (phospho-acceptor) domain-containing protein [Fibrobacter sp. UWEL]
MRTLNVSEILSYLKKHQAIVKDRLVFVSIFLVIGVPLSILFVHTYQQSSALAEKTQLYSANNAYQALSDDLTQDFNGENNRSYKVYGILNSTPVIGGYSPQISESFFFPDSAGPYCSFDVENNHCRKGLVGHFQIDQSNTLLTPFYPDTNAIVGKMVWDYYAFEDEKQRRSIRDLIKQLVDTLEIRNEIVSQESFQVVDSTKVAEAPIIDQLWDKNSNINIRRTEITSEDEALTYFVETAKMDSANMGRMQLSIGNDLSVVTSLFQAKYSRGYIVFYRDIGFGALSMVQGFVVNQNTYLNYRLLSLPREIANPDYAVELALDGKVENTRGRKKFNSRLIFEKSLSAPFEQLTFRVYSNSGQQLAGYTILLTGTILLIIIAICLITIYRFTRSKVDLATKRQDFVSAITHELKTPLAAIKMYAELLQNSWVANEEKKQRYYNQIASEADRLSRLIQNVLNLSKLDGNRWNVQLRMERPKAVIDDFLATYSKNVEKQGFELTVSTDMEADNIHLLIDRDAIMQILMNLVDNSLKFSKKSDYKMISIELAIKGTDMYMAVRDYGPGIPPSEMKKVFQEFYRVENEMTRQTSGTGIGLSMVKKLCTLCNMKIEVENANPGLRTKIHFPPLEL